MIKSCFICCKGTEKTRYKKKKNAQRLPSIARVVSSPVLVARTLTTLETSLHILRGITRNSHKELTPLHKGNGRLGEKIAVKML